MNFAEKRTMLDTISRLDALEREVELMRALLLSVAERKAGRPTKESAREVAGMIEGIKVNVAHG